MNDELRAASGRRGTWKWWVCGLLLLATMILYMDRLVLTQQEALIRKAFGIEHNDLAYGLLDSAFSVAFGFGALLAGWLADRWSVWLLYPLAVTLWSFTGGVTGLITGYWILFTCRFFLGFFESGHWPCALKTTQRILGPTQRTLGNGILQSGAAIGSINHPSCTSLACRYIDELACPLPVHRLSGDVLDNRLVLPGSPTRSRSAIQLPANAD